MPFSRRRRDSPRVDLTPMVDVVFLLLIFFMISTTFIDAPGLAVKLPRASQAQLIQQVEEVRVYLTADGSVFLGQEQVETAQLSDLLMAYDQKAEQMTFVLMADQQVRHGRVVEVMDLAKKAGFRKLAIATEKKQGK